jgi:regulator of sirC expression with transglutaminase-like and TPR domain
MQNTNQIKLASPSSHSTNSVAKVVSKYTLYREIHRMKLIEQNQNKAETEALDQVMADEWRFMKHVEDEYFKLSDNNHNKKISDQLIPPTPFKITPFEPDEKVEVLSKENGKDNTTP